MKYQLLIIVLLGLTLAPGSMGAGAADISGTWDCSVKLENGATVPVTLVFKLAGEKLTGTASGASGEHKVTGTVKGNEVKFSIEGKLRSGEPFTYNYTGTIESSTKMTGTCEFPKGQGKWTATKK